MVFVIYLTEINQLNKFIMGKKITKAIINKINEIASKEGFTSEITRLSQNSFSLELQIYAPNEKDCLCAVNFKNDLDDFLSSFEESMDIDVDYETYLWLGNDGHGKNGAPYHIKDILSDVEWFTNKLENLNQKFIVEFLSK